MDPNSPRSAANTGRAPTARPSSGAFINDVVRIKTPNTGQSPAGAGSIPGTPPPSSPSPMPSMHSSNDVAPAGSAPTQPPMSKPADPSDAGNTPSTSIKFHVPGVTSEEPEQAPADPGPITTFDRDAPPPVAPRSANPTGKHHQGLRDILSIAGVLVSALLLAFCLITFVFQSYQVDGPSMQTTLQNSDHLIVWKVPKSFANLTHRAYIPNRGDVIVFNEPNLSDFGQDSGKQLIKRVMALPGERVVVKDGVLTVYNQAHPDGFQPDKTLPYGKVIVTTPGNIDERLGDKQIFVCGDNRTNSLDSRVFGPVDSSNIVGKLVLRVLPLNTLKKF
jgi:signal peptidase I